MRLRYVIYAVIILIAIGCSKGEKSANIFASAEFCSDCHETIYDEWKESMHAKSTPMNDKVLAAVFKLTGNDIKTGTKDGKVPVCVNCHVPVAALDGEVDLTKKTVYSEGVTCTFCHKIKSLKKLKRGRLGAYAYKYYPDDVYASTMVDAKSDGHETQYSVLFNKSEICSGCHWKRENSNGVNVCNTYEEYKTSKKSRYMTCQNCHMPKREGRVAESSNAVRKVHFHGSTGGHDIDRVKESVDMSIEVDLNSGDFSVIIKNVNAAHKLPTAAPLRQIFVKVTQLGSKGRVIIGNYKDSPKEDKKALFSVAFEDADGKIGVPPWKAVKIASDTRLKPDEERIIIYDIAGKKVKKVRAELYYRLVPESLAKDNDFDEYTKSSHLIAEVEVTL